VKKRILFVDDDPLVLQGLQRMLRVMRNEWEMEFVESGAKALERLAQMPFDVVVADMRMPVMNGAQLLNEVMKRYPQTVRLILSGHADQELILKCVGTTHQYLSKPCEPEALKAVLVRASALGTSLQSDRLKKLVARLQHLPSLPSLYVQIVEKLQDPEAPLEDVATIIARDIGMTAQILKLVNSAFFGLRQEIASPTEAVTYLGLSTIKTLVLGVQIFAQFGRLSLGRLSLKSLWEHSLNTGAAAKAISQTEGAERSFTEEAFVAGMLHDAGRLILAANFPGQYAGAYARACSNRWEMQEAELQAFGATHADVGGYLFGLWGLPVPLVEAIALHHKPAQAPGRSFSPLTAVHVADAFVTSSWDKQEGIAPSQVDTAYLAELGLAERVEAWREAVAEKMSTVKTA
jgi:HD-like signal output (HDOD) protein